MDPIEENHKEGAHEVSIMEVSERKSKHPVGCK